MGRNSSGTRGGLQPGDATYKGSVGKPEPLVNMKDPALYKATKEAISRYHSVLGVRQKNVKLAELSAGTYGVHVTANGKSEGVYLNKKHFMQTKKAVEASHKRGYASGWSTKTNKAVAHTVTHELAHATWNANMTGANQKAAGKEVSLGRKTIRNPGMESMRKPMCRSSGLKPLLKRYMVKVINIPRK